MERRKPESDMDRLQNMIDGLRMLFEDDEPTDDEIREEYRAAGIDLDARAAEFQAKAEAGVRADRERQARKQTTKLVLLAGGTEADVGGGAATVKH